MEGGLIRNLVQKVRLGLRNGKYSKLVKEAD